MARRVLAVLTDPLQGAEELEEIRRALDGEGAELRLVAPAVEASAFRHALGDVDEPAERAREVLQRSLAALRAAGLEANGEVGDAEPVQAAKDALATGPADEVLIFEHAATQARWYESGLFEKAQEELEPPLRMVVIEDAAGEPPHVVDIEEAGAGTAAPHEREIGTAYLSGLSLGDFAGIVAGIVGTIVVIVLAAVVTADDGTESGAGAAAILIAIFTALINMAHVVGLTLFESVHYRGGFERFFRTLSLVGTPTAIAANLLILLLS